MPYIVWFIASLSMPAHAWGPTGHRIVGELAERQLTRGARVEIKHLLATTRDQSLADVANWADELHDERSQRTLWRTTSKLHFLNFFSSSCHYDPARDCAAGQCIVAAIDRHARVLGDRTRSDRDRAEALRFVVHFVADVHQPMHAGYRRDKGGNRYPLQWDGHATNLHAIWDSPVLASRHVGWSAYAAALARSPLPQATGTPSQWAEESCRMTRDDGIYPHGHRIDQDYLTRMRPLAEQRLRIASARLAALLNRELAPRSRSPR